MRVQVVSKVVAENVFTIRKTHCLPCTIIITNKLHKNFIVINQLRKTLLLYIMHFFSYRTETGKYRIHFCYNFS